MSPATRELKRIVAEIDQTFAEIDGIKDRLSTHAFELAALRRDMETTIAGDAAADARVEPGVVAMPTAHVGFDRALEEKPVAFETHYHCPERHRCSCSGRKPVENCPGRQRLLRRLAAMRPAHLSFKI